jgi:hypothetical protein
MSSGLGTAGAAIATTSCALLLGIFGACEGPAFTAAPTAGAGGQDEVAEGGAAAGGAGGAPASAGTTVGGEPSLAGAGQGGAASDVCGSNAECETGTFCNEGACTSCADLGDLSQLEYGQVEPLDIINATAGTDHLRFPRPVGEGLGLVYAREFYGGHLWFTSDSGKNAGTSITVGEGVHETGGLSVPYRLPAPLTGYDFFFHRTVMDTSPQTKLFGAKLTAAGVVSGATVLPDPFNGSNVNDSHSLALSEHRAVWLRNNDGALDIHLVTLALPPTGTEAVELRLPLPYDCGFASELSYSPWLSQDGKALFFVARAVDATSCTPTADTPTRIYVIALSDVGEPQGAARALEGLGAEDARQTDPALTPDSCHLYFSATFEQTMGLFRAERVR